MNSQSWRMSFSIICMSMTAHCVFIAKRNLNIEPQTIFTAVGMCTKNLCHIFMLTYFTSHSFRSFDAVIIFSRCKREINCSSHVTICTNHVKLHIFNLRPFIFSIFAGSALKHQSVRFYELYKLKSFTVTIETGGIKWVN